MTPDPLTKLIRALMLASAGITFGQLARETANDYFFTLVGLILLAAALPYLLATAAITRTPPRWAKAIAIVTCLWGVADATWRVQAFYFPTPASNRAMAFWLPIYGVCAIAFFSVIAHTFLTAFRPENPAVGTND
ncbi:MAG: hypothetical protein AB7K63_14045 [Vicinamibacterales bacterium]